jgi:hypothetical protein
MRRNLGTLVQRDSEILQTLTCFVRVLTLSQVARTWWPGSTSHSAKRRLEQLHTARLIDLYLGLVHPELALEAPLLEWSPGELAPNFEKTSYRLKRRWALAPVATWCAIATRSSAVQFGGFGGRFPRDSELTHDVHLSAIFLGLRRRSPETAALWKSEAAIRREAGRARGPRPDAFIELPTGTRVVEFGGAYSASKLEAFHCYCESQGLPYELW